MIDRSSNANVVPFPRDPRRVPAIDHCRASPFDELTATIIMARHARGELAPGVLAALLQGCGFNIEAPQ